MAILATVLIVLALALQAAALGGAFDKAIDR